MRAVHGLETVGTTLCGTLLRDDDGRDRNLIYVALIPGQPEMLKLVTCKKCRQQKKARPTTLSRKGH